MERLAAGAVRRAAAAAAGRRCPPARAAAFRRGGAAAAAAARYAGRLLRPAAARQGQGRGAASAADDGPGLFDSVDAQTYTSFVSKQLDLVRPADGRRVSLFPMQHVASRAFYDGVLKELQRPDRFFLVLIEGIMDSVEAMQQEQDMATKLAQDEARRTKMLEWIEEGGHVTEGEAERLFSELCVPYPPPAELDLVHQELYFKPRLLCSVPLKVQNSDVLATKVAELTSDEDRARFLLHGRSEHCARVLRGHLEQELQEYPDCPGADSIAVCWGQAHCRLLADDLSARGFVAEEQGPRREYGWTEDLFNAVLSRWRAEKLPSFL
eukprot:TRINITY_DN7009_c0_g3_i1.p1 TRINITY_DN7009_c0_g3~~TRINITY_DN7009_c0_g3_i1.p1  ORF type:complete len:349 (+),score=129.54 TRINITY_DN7009_c0_g3_i1:77-1048(+)